MTEIYEENQFLLSFSGFLFPFLLFQHKVGTKHMEEGKFSFLFPEFQTHSKFMLLGIKNIYSFFGHHSTMYCDSSASKAVSYADLYYIFLQEK